MSINLSAVINNHLEMQQRQLLLPSVSWECCQSCQSRQPVATNPPAREGSIDWEEETRVRATLLLSLSSQLLEVCPLDI